MKDISHPARIAQGLFFLTAFIWLIFGLSTLVGMASRHSELKMAVYVIGFMMLGNVAAMGFSGLLIGKGNKWFYYFAVLALVINIVLTVTDQFGFFDLITLAIDLLLFGTLISIRKHVTTLP